MGNDIAKILLMAKVVGGGGGSSVSVEPLSVTENGEYTAEAGKAYSPVTVSVPQISVASISITENGTYNAPANTAYDVVDVNVSGGGDEDAEDGIIMRTISHITNSRTEKIGDYAFCQCLDLISADFQNANKIGAYAFSGCSRLETISFPLVTEIGSNAFAACQYVSTASFPSLQKISAYAFSQAFRLVSLYLTGTSIASLVKSNAFSNCPIGGYSVVAKQYGSIYVPSSLLTTYQASTNWAYFSSRFVGV